MRSTVPWTIGSSYSYYRSIGFARTFNGVIDEVKLYNRALSANEILEAAESDVDADGIADAIDNCVNVANSDQNDTDGDNVGDACDDDIDGDNVLNGSDNCPLNANADQIDTDGDGVGNACDGDIDGDGVLNENDNCSLNPNADQSDLDGDGLGNVCDDDIDGDGLANANDRCPTSDRMTQVVVGFCNSKVPNHLLAGGCTIVDEIGECGISASNHGDFVNCVARLLNTLRNSGVITGPQKGSIQSCSAQADIP